METTIANNIPVPVKQESRYSKLDKLEIGQSFGFKRTERRLWQSLISNDFHSMTKKRFTISIINQPQEEARVWRLEDAEDEVQAAV